MYPMFSERVCQFYYSVEPRVYVVMQLLLFEPFFLISVPTRRLCVKHYNVRKMACCLSEEEYAYTSIRTHYAKHKTYDESVTISTAVLQ